MPETRALTESTIRIKVIENTELKDRDAMLYFYAGHQCSDTLTIHQTSIDYIAFEKPAEVPYESGTISIEIQHSSNFKIDREEWYSANLSQTIDKWYLLTSEMVNPNLTKLTINYEENHPRLSYEDLFSVYPRKLALYMSAGSVNKLLILTQNVGPTFIINAEEIDVTAAAKIQNIIQADCPYELYIPTEARDWLSPYTENDMTQLSITANRSSSPREATITVSALDHKLSAEIKIKQAGAVVIPDPAFRKYLSEKGYIEIIEESDGICAIESSDITYFDIPSETASLKGIEYFQKLKNLDLSLNRNLTDADLSMLPLLELVHCNYCYNLTSLDLHDLTNLKKLSIEGNSYPKSLLKVLNIEGCCALEELDCCDNLLTYIDVSNKPMLQKVNCRNNDLRSLDFNNGPTTLSALNCDDNSMLSHINFGNIEYINGHGDYYDSSYISYAMSLSSSELTITGPRLQYLSVNSDNIKKLDLSKCPVLTRLSSMCSQITELDISQNYNLEYLRFYPSNTSFWDFSPYKSLKRLYIYSDINSIDISCCTELTHLSIRAHIADLNLQNNVKLKVLSLSNPGFAKLDLTNFMDLESLTLGYNAQLSSRIELNEVILGDKPMLQRVYCKGYDNIYERRTIKVLSLGKCPVLQKLNCSYQLIENLNLENCPKLQTLECQYNQISSLDLTNKYDLISLNCEYNNIIELNTTQTWLGHSTGTPVKCLNNPLARIFVTTDANITGWMIPNTTEIIYQ